MTAELECVLPYRYGVEVCLRDGQRVLLRPIRPNDTQAWMAFIDRCSLQAKYLRFHHAVKQLKPQDAARFCTVDYARDFAVVAEIVRHESKDIVAIGRYYRLADDRSAEIAILVEDAYQGKGLGTQILQCLRDAARESSITRFEAEVLAENIPMITLFEGNGCHVKRIAEDGVYHVCYPVTFSEDSQDGKCLSNAIS